MFNKWTFIIKMNKYKLNNKHFVLFIADAFSNTFLGSF